MTVFGKVFNIYTFQRVVSDQGLYLRRGVSIRSPSVTMATPKVGLAGTEYHLSTEYTPYGVPRTPYQDISQQAGLKRLRGKSPVWG